MLKCEKLGIPFEVSSHLNATNDIRTAISVQVVCSDMQLKVTSIVQCLIMNNKEIVKK